MKHFNLRGKLLNNRFFSFKGSCKNYTEAKLRFANTSEENAKKTLRRHNKKNKDKIKHATGKKVY